jgi:5-formyltetrahydrofolate cyclo-ligase
MTKSELRQIYLTRQKSLSRAEREIRSRQITEQFFEHFTLENFKNLHLFLSIEKNGEIDTQFIYQKIRQDFPPISLFAPRVRESELEHLAFTEQTKLVENSWQISEPAGDELFDEKLFDMVIVPMLCFDKSGYRVGYGKGFYDRFLSKCRPDCLKIGVSFFEPVDEISDINRFDVKLDYCLTPNRVWKF